MSPFNNHTSMKRTRVNLLIIWIFSIILAGPFLYFYKFRWRFDRENGLKPYCSHHNPTFKIVHFIEENFPTVKQVCN